MNHKSEISYNQLALYNYCAGGLFLFLFLFLSFHNRLASDDFFYLFLYKKFGAWEGMLYQYDQWSGRWAAHFLACLLLKFSSSQFFLPTFGFFTLATLFFSLRITLKRIYTLLGVTLSSHSLTSFSLLTLTCFFFTSYTINETWFWYIIVITYLWSLIAFLVLLHSVFSTSGNSIHFYSIVLTSLFIGGASESYALISLFIIAVLILYRWKRLKKKLSEQVLSRLLLAFIVLTISFGFSVAAPGTWIRYSLLPHPSPVEKFYIAGKALLKYFVRFLPEKSIYIILFSFPWFLMGTMHSGVNFPKTRVKLTLINITLLFILTLVLFFLPTAVIMAETGPGRALSIVSLATTVYFSIVFFLFGTRFKKDNLIVKIFFMVVFPSALLVSAYHLRKQIPTAIKFAEKYDERMETIQHSSTTNRIGVLVLEKLPTSGMLYWEELSTDTSYFVNKHLKDGLGLKFPLAVK